MRPAIPGSFPEPVENIGIRWQAHWLPDSHAKAAEFGVRRPQLPLLRNGRVDLRIRTIHH